MGKNLKAEDLEQDLLIEYSSRILHYYQNNKATVVGGGIGLILTIGLVIGFFVYSSQQDNRAQELLGIAEQSFLMGDYNTALNGSDADFTLGFVQIANNYSRTSAGNLAFYYAAISEFELGNYESALDFMSQFTVPSGILGVSPITLHANILLELERYENAARMFERAAEWNENSSTTPSNLYSAAEAYNEAGLSNNAQTVVDRILSDYPSSPAATKAQRLRGMIASSR